MKILFQPIILLGCFVLLKVCQFLFDLGAAEEHFMIGSLRVITLALWIWLAYHAVKGQMAAQWIMALVLFLHAIGLFFGVFAISAELLLLKIGALVAGVYFAAGAVALGNLARRQVRA